MDDNRFDRAGRSNRLDVLPELKIAVRMDEGGWIQSDEFLAGVTVHLARSRIGFDHPVGLRIKDDQPVADRFKDI
jgi:hypothetical protein